MTVTPFVFEPVGDLIDRIDTYVRACATDQRHPKGGRGSVARFRAAIGDRDSTPFFTSNAAALVP